MKITIVFFSILICLTIFFVQGLFPQSSEIGSIKITQNYDDGVLFNIYDLMLYDLKDREVIFGFWISQNRKWLDNSWVGLNPETIGYNPAFIEGEAFWFYYPYELLKNIGNTKRSYYGSFFVVDADTDNTISQFDVKFNLKDNHLEEFSTDSSNNKEEYDIENLEEEGSYISKFQWVYDKKDWNMDFKIQKSDYNFSVHERDSYKPKRGRVLDEGGYITLWGIEFNEFYNDLYGYLYLQNKDRLKDFKQNLLKAKEKHSFSYDEFASFIICCIQYTTYKLPEKLFGIYTQPELIVLKTGDCDSRAVILYTILKDFGYNVAVFYSDYYEHAMLGIAQVGYGDYLTYRGIKYYFVETTAIGWEIGELPPEFSNTRHWELLIP